MERLGTTGRFIISGVLNTLATYTLFLALSELLHHIIAYTISYIVGIALSYILAAMFVFRTGVDRRSALRFPSVYIAQYFYGLIALAVLVDRAGLRHGDAMVVVIFTSIPLTFVMSRWILRS
jgi:putative flippase GtrA